MKLQFFLHAFLWLGWLIGYFINVIFLPKILDLNVRLEQYSESNCLIKLIIFLDFFGNCQFSWVVYFIVEIRPGSLEVLCVAISYWYFWELFLFKWQFSCILFLLQYFFELDFFHYCFLKSFIHNGTVAKLCLSSNLLLEICQKRLFQFTARNEYYNKQFHRRKSEKVSKKRSITSIFFLYVALLKQILQ